MNLTFCYRRVEEVENRGFIDSCTYSSCKGTVVAIRLFVHPECLSAISVGIVINNVYKDCRNAIKVLAQLHLFGQEC